MSRIKFNFFAALFFVSYCFAHAQQTAVPRPAEIYKACCGAAPVEFKWGDTYVFVPNVFTPNNDGINDYFMPVADKDRVAISNFTVLSAVGDTILFQCRTFRFDNAVADSWNGFRPDGTAYKGLFKYRMEVSNGTVQPILIEGSACRLVCGPDAAAFKTKEGCFYITQLNNRGILDANAPNYDEGCFK